MSIVIEEYKPNAYKTFGVSPGIAENVLVTTQVIEPGETSAEFSAETSFIVVKPKSDSVWVKLGSGATVDGDDCYFVEPMTEKSIPLSGISNTLSTILGASEAFPMSIGATPRFAASVLNLGVAKTEYEIDADLATATDQPILYTRICLDASDDVDASTRLMSGVGCKTLLPGERRQFTLGYSGQRFYMIGVGSAVEPADYTGGVGIMSVNEDDVADVQAQMFMCDLNTQEQTRTVTIAMTSTYNSGLSARLLVEADSHV